jgi:hypothetical protein
MSMNASVPYGLEGAPMVIDDAVMTTAWSRSDGRCECRSLAHGHDLRCNRPLVWPNRDRTLGRGAWGLRFRTNGGNDGRHIEVVCAECLRRAVTTGQ